MAAAPTPIFEVTIAVPGEMRWCMRAKGMFDDWLHNEAESDKPRPIEQLPAADMEMVTTEVCELHLTWIELPADNSWDAVKRATAIVEDVVPELLRTRRIRLAAKLQDPDADARRPVGA
ncbi:MAG: hypothetical protein QOG15_106 [Solirubrobacteraceae bacterium]|nr:hypothetical protein [Solirubrobacteraceae bacterium]